MSEAKELKIFQKMYDFTLWMTNHTTKFPKSQRFTYAVKIENAMLEVLKLIQIANRSRDKIVFIRKIDIAA